VLPSLSSLALSLSVALNLCKAAYCSQLILLRSTIAIMGGAYKLSLLILLNQTLSAKSERISSLKYGSVWVEFTNFLKQKLADIIPR
jgi:hypothetical protein